MKKIKTILFIMVLSTFFVVDNTLFAAFGVENINEGLIGDDQTVDITVQSYIQILLGFLYLLAVLYGLYGGFLIFTAQDDDDKVKDGKKIIIRALLGVVIIFLAGPIVEFIIGQGSGQEGILTE